MSDAAIKLSGELQNLAGQLDDALDEITGERCVFCVCVGLPTDQGGTLVQYVSNTDRAGGVALLESLLQRWRDGHPDVPEHMKN